MKKYFIMIFSVILASPLFSQTIDDWSFEPPITDNNMSVVFPAGQLTEFAGQGVKAYVVRYTYGSPMDEYFGAPPIDSIIVPVSNTTMIQEDGSVGFAVIGADGLCNCNLAVTGEILRFIILLDDELIINIEYGPPLTYVSNGFAIISFGLSFTSEIGCAYEMACNYSGVSVVEFYNNTCEFPLEYRDCDGVCINDTWETQGVYNSVSAADNVCDDDEVLGCTNPFEYNFNILATEFDGSCMDLTSFTPPSTENNMSVIFPSPLFADYIGGNLVASVDGVPVSQMSPIDENGAGGVAVIGTDNLCGCDLADNGEQIDFHILINGEVINLDVEPAITYSKDDFILVDANITFSVLGYGCTSSWADNYDLDAVFEDGSCFKNGCTDSEATNYDPISTIDDNSCIYFLPISLQLSSGWNMVGYTGTVENNGIANQMNAALSSGSVESTFQVIKNVSGAFWSSAFAQINTFNPGEGYMMYVIEGTPSVTFADPYIPGISIDLNSGWNMIAFTGDENSNNSIQSSMDAALSEGTTENTFQVIKNVSGAFWSSAFAQISTFTPGEAYMMYVISEALPSVSFVSE